jgi:hypothetical protein
MSRIGDSEKSLSKASGSFIDWETLDSIPPPLLWVDELKTKHLSVSPFPKQRIYTIFFRINDLTVEWGSCFHLSKKGRLLRGVCL